MTVTDTPTPAETATDDPTTATRSSSRLGALAHAVFLMVTGSIFALAAAYPASGATLGLDVALFRVACAIAAVACALTFVDVARDVVHRGRTAWIVLSVAGIAIDYTMVVAGIVVPSWVGETLAYRLGITTRELAVVAAVVALAYLTNLPGSWRAARAIRHTIRERRAARAS